MWINIDIDLCYSLRASSLAVIICGSADRRGDTLAHSNVYLYNP
jgi:hypothetical protein